MTVIRIALAKPKNPQFWNRCCVNVCIRMCLFWMLRYIETGSLARRTLINLNVVRRWLDTLSFWLTIYLQYKWQWNKSLLFAKCNFIFYVWHWFHVNIFSALGLHSEPQTHVGYIELPSRALLLFWNRKYFGANSKFHCIHCDFGSSICQKYFPSSVQT